MLGRFLDSGSLVHRTRFYPLIALAVGSTADRQRIDFLAVGYPASLRGEPEFLLDPILDSFVCRGTLPEAREHTSFMSGYPGYYASVLKNTGAGRISS